MYWFNVRFKQYCIDKKYKLLRDDYKFIEKALYKMPKNEQRLIMRRYLEEWDIGMRVGCKVHQKQNFGRFRANTFLREYVELQIQLKNK